MSPISIDAPYTATGAVLDVAGVICQWIVTGRGWRSRFQPLCTSGMAPDDHFWSADAMAENTWNQLAIHLTVGIY